MKVFGIGLSRTGTASLAEALRLLNYSCVHFPTTRTQIEGFDAATDTPVAADFVALDAYYPDSKFIYTYRDMEAWLNSCRKMFGVRPLASLKEQERSYFRELRMRIYGVPEFDECSFRVAFVRHERAVMHHFEGREHVLLKIDICSGAGWESLCPFLGVEIPDVAFPHKDAVLRPEERPCQ